MNTIEKKLKELNNDLFARLQETKVKIELLLQQYAKNFPTYTDHSLKHTLDVYKLVSEVLNEEEINNLNDQELYCLSMASLLHDVGMCLPVEKINEFETDKRFTHYKERNPTLTTEDLIRDLHHELSYDFILKEYKLLKIPNEEYAEAIALISKGHRKVELNNIDEYKAKFKVDSGRSFVCLPYLAAILRLSDELDVTNTRTPELLLKYYTPENEKSKLEWEKHQSTYMVNMDEDTISIKAKSDDQNVYNALKTQFEKIDKVLEYCQKVIRNIGNTGTKTYSLTLTKIEHTIKTSLDFKNIKFSVDVANVITTLMGEKLYDSKLVPIRELIQNALDSCMYKQSFTEAYEPKITITLLEDKIICEDNGVGMDEYIVEKYFAKLSSSYYKNEKLKTDYDSIGRFGIGVFSYFLIADYIEVETKKENALPLKFRADKNPENYFYFFNEVEKNICGTRITLEYKNGIENLNFKEIKDYINRVFEFVNIPIELDYLSQKETVGKAIEEIDINSFISENILPIYRNDFFNTPKIIHRFDNDKLEGVISFFPELPFNSCNCYDISMKSSRDRDNGYRVFNKGIFVENIDSIFLEKKIGNINIKKSIDINVSRNKFDKKDLIKSIFEEEIFILNKLFKDLTLTQDKEKVWDICSNKLISYDFLNSMGYENNNHLFFDYDMVKLFFLENAFFKCYRNKKKTVVSLKQIFNDESCFFLIDYYLDDNASKFALNFNNLMIQPNFDERLLIPAFVNDSYRKYLVIFEDCSLIFWSKNDEKKYFLIDFFNGDRYSFIKKNDVLLEYVGIRLDKPMPHFFSELDFVFNTNNDLINFLFEKIKLDNDKSYDGIMARNMIQTIQNLLCHLDFESQIDLEYIQDKIKSIYANINSHFSTNFKFTKSHLPRYLDKLAEMRNN